MFNLKSELSTCTEAGSNIITDPPYCKTHYYTLCIRPNYNFLMYLNYKDADVEACFETLVLVRQPKSAGFRPKSRYEYIIGWFSQC